MTSEQEQQLIAAALQGVSYALTENNTSSDSRYGAAVLTEAGAVYASGQYYSKTQTLTLHAEQSALAHAAAHGAYDIIAIAVASNKTETGYPCHMCKQLLWESHLRSGHDIEILIINDEKITERFLLSEIMSHTWPKK